MSKPRSRKFVSEYDSDDGFVEDAAPKAKKQKKIVTGEMQKDDEGNEYWELSGKRRVQLSDFKGQTMVNIREYYEKDGKSLPGKKGISLMVDQYSALIDLLPDIERVLKGRGIEVPRPQYDGKAAASKKGAERDEDGVDNEDPEDGEQVAAPQKGKLDRFKMEKKKNHEATSDEDEGD